MTLSDSTVPMFLSNALQSSTFAVTYPVSASNAASDSGAMSFAAATSTETPDPIVVVVGASKASDGLSTGKLVAAVLVPILVLLTGLGFYVRYVRSKQAKKRNRCV
jgi:Ca2+/Na+ antiporter